MQPQVSRSHHPQASGQEWPTLRRIVCPVDFSSCSRAAAQHAVALARQAQAEITGLLVLPFTYPPGDPASPFGQADPVAPKAADIAAAAGRLEELFGPAREAGLTVRTRVESGDCVGYILDQAQDADLIVMGTHGRSGLARVVLGSVAERVLSKAPCPVVTVSQAASRRRLRLSAHVLEGVRGIKARARCAEDVHHELEAAALERGAPGHAVRVVVVAGEPFAAITRVGAAQRAGLVVLGRALGRGAIGHRLVRESPVPVLTVPPRVRAS